MMKENGCVAELCHGEENVVRGEGKKKRRSHNDIHRRNVGVVDKGVAWKVGESIVAHVSAHK